MSRFRILPRQAALPTDWGCHRVYAANDRPPGPSSTRYRQLGATPPWLPDEAPWRLRCSPAVAHGTLCCTDHGGVSNGRHRICSF